MIRAQLTTKTSIWTHSYKSWDPNKFQVKWLNYVWGYSDLNLEYGSTLPGGLQFMGSLRVRHDWVTSLSLFTFMHWWRTWQPTSVFLPGESQGWGSLVGCCLWGCRVRHDGSDLVAAAAELCYVIPMALVQTDLGQAWPTGGSKWKQPVIRKCPVETNAWNTWSFVFEDGPIIL